MSDRARALAAQWAEVSDEVAVFIAECPEDRWLTRTAEEGWPICSVCRHIARGFEMHPQVLRLAVAGEPLPTGYTWDDIHRSNAEQAAAWASISKDDALAPLRQYGNAAVEFVAELSDEQLNRVVFSPLDAMPMSVQEMIEGMIDHPRPHLRSARVTLLDFTGR